MFKNYDYKKLYQDTFKNLPNFYFILTLIPFGIAAFCVFVGFAFSYMLIPGILIAAIVLAVGVGISMFCRYIFAIFISQMVVVADSLVELSEKNNAPASAPSIDAFNL